VKEKASFARAETSWYLLVYCGVLSVYRTRRWANQKWGCTSGSRAPMNGGCCRCGEGLRLTGLTAGASHKHPMLCWLTVQWPTGTGSATPTPYPLTERSRLPVFLAALRGSSIQLCCRAGPGGGQVEPSHWVSNFGRTQVIYMYI
jgi:hypothetical protein